MTLLPLAVNRRIALAIGLALPVAETLRRASDLGAWWLWIDDYLIGAVLLAAFWISRAGTQRGGRALAAAWGVTSGMGYYSFVGHLLALRTPDASGLPGWVPALVVGIGLLLAILALLSSVFGQDRT